MRLLKRTYGGGYPEPQSRRNSTKFARVVGAPQALASMGHAATPVAQQKARLQTALPSAELPKCYGNRVDKMPNGRFEIEVRCRGRRSARPVDAAIQIGPNREC